MVLISISIFLMSYVTNKGKQTSYIVLINIYLCSNELRINTTPSQSKCVVFSQSQFDFDYVKKNKFDLFLFLLCWT